MNILKKRKRDCALFTVKNAQPCSKQSKIEKNSNISTTNFVEIENNGVEEENSLPNSNLPFCSKTDNCNTTSKKRKYKKNEFESNLLRRKNIYKKLQNVLNEHCINVEQCAMMILKIEPELDFEVFGTRSLKNVLKKLKTTILKRIAITNPEEPKVVDPNNLFELPILMSKNIPVNIDELVQTELRTLIPKILKCSSGRGKPGWGIEQRKPVWWPEECPYKNIRIDSRTIEEKERIPWTNLLRQIVINCYTYHGREDLLWNAGVTSPVETFQEQLNEPMQTTNDYQIQKIFDLVPVTDEYGNQLFLMNDQQNLSPIMMINAVDDEASNLMVQTDNCQPMLEKFSGDQLFITDDQQNFSPIMMTNVVNDEGGVLCFTVSNNAVVIDQTDNTLQVIENNQPMFEPFAAEAEAEASKQI